MEKQPTTEQLIAIRKYARIEGKRWKASLRQAWMTGDYGVHGDVSPLLQQVRNSFGPSWLVKFKLIEEPAIMNGCAVLTRSDEAIYVRLPRELQVSAFGPCSCGKCDGEGRFDTLMVPINPGPHDYVTVVHLPDAGIAGFNDAMKRMGTEFKR